MLWTIGLRPNHCYVSVMPTKDKEDTKQLVVYHRHHKGSMLEAIKYFYFVMWIVWGFHRYAKKYTINTNVILVEKG